MKSEFASDISVYYDASETQSVEDNFSQDEFLVADDTITALSESTIGSGLTSSFDAPTKLNRGKSAQEKSPDSTLRAYMTAASKHKLLSGTDEIRLGRSGKAGDAQALEKLAVSNLRLVISISKRYMNHGMDLEDLIQEGNLGLLHAVKRFDPTRGNKFSTYATWWIRQAITRALTNKSRTIRTPVHVAENMVKIKKIARPFIHKEGRFPTPAELVAASGLNLAEVLQTLRGAPTVTSLDAVVGIDKDVTLDEFIEDAHGSRPELQAEQVLLTAKISQMMKQLTKVESEVLINLYGLGRGESMTSNELAKKWSVDVAFIRRTSDRAVRKLKRHTRKSKLSDFLADP